MFQLNISNITNFHGKDHFLVIFIGGFFLSSELQVLWAVVLADVSIILVFFKALINIYKLLKFSEYLLKYIKCPEKTIKR